MGNEGPVSGAHPEAARTTRTAAQAPTRPPGGRLPGSATSSGASWDAAVAVAPVPGRLLTARPPGARFPSVSPPALLGLQRLIGNAAVSELLKAEPTLSSPAEPDATVQRFVTSDKVRELAGPEKPDKKIGPVTRRMSQRYKAVLGSLDAYHMQCQQLWTTNASAGTFRDSLSDSLTQLVGHCDGYLRRHKATKKGVPARTKTIIDLRDQEIPAERRLIAGLAGDLDFGAYDRTRPVGEAAEGLAGSAKDPAKITGAGVEADTEVPNGHGMAVWVKIDSGRAPIDPDPAPTRRSVYGVKFEYWEDVKIFYDFTAADPSEADRKKKAKAGAKDKQWNDVYGMQPGAATFEKISDPIELSWADAVKAAKAGTLAGKQTIGIYDKPSVDVGGNRHALRRLRFRILFTDAHGSRREIQAQQTLALSGGEQASFRSYADSAGNRLAHSHGGDREQPRAFDERLAPQIDLSTLVADVPQRAKDAIADFARRVKEEKAKDFDFKELDLIKSRIHDEGTRQAAYKGFTRKGAGPDVLDPAERYEIAGWNLLPYPESGWKLKEYRLSGGGLLVAIVEGTTILKMFYTDNATVRLSTTKYNDWDVRSFAEIPIESVDAAPRTASTEMRVAFSSKKSLVEYIQANPGQTRRVHHEYDLRFGRDKFSSHIGDYFAELLATGGSGPAAYKSLRDRLPSDRVVLLSLDGAYRRLHQSQGLDDAQDAYARQTGLGPQIAGLSPDDSKSLLKLVRRQPTDVTEIEEKFNTFHAPSRFGQVAFEGLQSLLQTAGKGKATYKMLLEGFPGLEYLLRPAYRELFGQTALQSVLGELRSDKLAAAIPDPGGRANQDAKRAFLGSGPYSVTDFEPSPGGRFDGVYDPRTGKLQIGIRCAFAFEDYTKDKNVTGGATGTLATKTWGDSAKRTYLADLKRVVADTWTHKFQILCERPGWGDVAPVDVAVGLREVPAGTEHVLITINKGVLADKDDGSGNQYLSPSPSEGGRSWVDTDQMKTQLQEWDVKDKIADPVFHQYLHSAEKSQHVDKSYRTDGQRIQQVCARFGSIAFGLGSARPADSQGLLNLVTEMRRMIAYSSLTKVQTIDLSAGAAVGEDPGLANQRLSLIKRLLTGAGYSRLQEGRKDLAEAVVKVSVVGDDPGARREYQTRWMRLSAAHEAGHMLGLADEYNPAASTKLLKRLISEGLLPPGTSADHLSGEGAGQAHAQGSKQDAFADLLEANNLPTPDFTDKANAKTTSLMGAGFDVMAAHYTTIWEALTYMTKDHLEPTFWRIKA